MSTVPPGALQDVGQATRIAAALAASGRRLAFGACPTTGAPTAVLHELDGTERLLPLSVVVDPAALAAALGTPGARTG